MSRLVYCAAVKPLREWIDTNPRRALRSGTLLLAAAGLLVLAAAAFTMISFSLVNVSVVPKALVSDAARSRFSVALAVSVRWSDHT